MKNKKNSINTKNELSELTKQLLPQRMDITSKYIEQSNFFRQVILIKNLPATTSTDCLLLSISQIKNTTFSMRISPMSQRIATDLVDKQINNSYSKGFSKKGTQQIEAHADLEVIQNFYENLIKEKGKIFYLNIFIEVYANSIAELKQKNTEVANLLASNHITATDLNYEQKEGFLSVVPFGKDDFKSCANNVPSSTLANMYPLSYSSKNDPNGMLLGNTIDGGSMFIDLWNWNDDITNGCFCITGESGFGKSYLMKKILSQQIARGTHTYILDFENEYSSIISKMGGSVINCASGKFIMNVFDIRTFKSDDELNKEENINEDNIETFNQDYVFFQHLSWLSDFFITLIPSLTAKERAGLSVFVKDIYNKKGIDEHTNIHALKPTDYPTFTDLYEYIEEVIKKPKLYDLYKNILSVEIIKDILLNIQDCYNGSLSVLFNGHTNITNSNIINFNLQELITGSSERTMAYMFNILTFIWNKILKKDAHNILIVDELYMILDPNNLTVAKYLRSFIKRARKYGSAIGTATQQLSDCSDEKVYVYACALFNTPSFKFMFNPGDLDFHKIKKLLSLTDGEINCIKNSKKKHCLFKCGNDKYNMYTTSLPFESELFGKAGGK